MATYVLITAAKNEGKYIEAVIASVSQQTIPPIRWIIVDDGSTDGTFTAAMEAAKSSSAIRIIRRKGRERGFASKAASLNHGWEAIKGHFTDFPPGFIGVVDADVTFPPEHFERLINVMAANKRLGLAGGWVWEAKGGAFRRLRSSRQRLDSLVTFGNVALDGAYSLQKPWNTSTDGSLTD